MAFTLGVILFAVGIGVSVALHEFGHLLTAKAFGMKASRYFIGFGPTLFSFRKGETEYGLKAVPAGGFVKIEGMTHAEEIAPGDEPRAFWRFAAWKRTVVLVAGSLTHFVLALLAIYGAAVTTGLLTDKAVVGTVQPCVVLVGGTDGNVRDCRPGDPAAPAAQAGLRTNDRIVRVGDRDIANYQDLLVALRSSPGQTVPVSYLRDGKEHTTTLSITATRRAPLRDDVEEHLRASSDGLVQVGAIGIAPSVTERFGPAAAVGETARFTGSTV